MYLIKLRIWVNFAKIVSPIIKNVAREMNCECMGDNSHFFSYVLVPTYTNDINSSDLQVAISR